MEIRDYLRAIRRILWLVIAVPVIAAILVGGFIELQPSVYQANATAIVPAITSNGISQSAASQYVSTFKDVLVSQTVVNDVSQKFGIPVTELVTGLSASTVTASSNYITVVLVGKHGQNLVGAVREAAIDTMNAIAEPQKVQADNEFINAETLWAAAETKLGAFYTTYNNLVPQVQYNDDQSTLNQQLAVLTTLKLNGDTVKAHAEQVTINATTAKLAQDASQLQIWQPLNSEYQAAQSAVEHARQQQVAADALVAANSNPNVVTTKNIGRLSKLGEVIKFAAIAFALGLLMMLGLILILELMRGGRRAQTPASATQQGAFAWQPPPAQTRPIGPPATPTMAAAVPTAPAAPSAAARDPWRTSPAPTAGDGGGNGNGNGNGHANGNGNGNGNAKTDAPDGDAQSQRAGGGIFRRR